MSTKRKQYAPALKAQIVLELLSNHYTLSELSTKHQVHSVQILKWKKQFLEAVPKIFTDKRKQEYTSQEQLISELYQQIGQSKVELDWMKKKIGLFS